jgi:hypothetical protein
LHLVPVAVQEGITSRKRAPPSVNKIETKQQPVILISDSGESQVDDDDEEGTTSVDDDSSDDEDEEESDDSDFETKK